MRKAFTASLLVFISCVGPADPDHGLVENLPAIVNKSDAFTFSLRADNFNYNESFPLSLSISSNKKMLSTLIISDFSSNDSSIIQILGDNDSVVFNYLINLNKTHSTSINYTNPKTASLKLNSFSGILNWVITESSE